MKITNSYIDLDKIHIEIEDFPAGEKFKPQIIKFTDFKGDNLDYETSNLDTSLLDTSANMFQNCSNLTSLDLSNLDFTNVTIMSSMFNGCAKLKTITFPEEFVSNKATNLQTMFQGCIQLRELDLSAFDTSNVTNLSYFFNRSSGYDIPVSYNLLKNSKITLNTSKCTNFNYMFAGFCNASLDVSELDISEARSMQNMFNNARFLNDESLDSILQMCANHSHVYMSLSNINLNYLGIKSTYYPASRIQALPHYQDFINNGWSIGY